MPKGTAFERKTGFLRPEYVCFTVYDAEYKNVAIAFPKQSLHNTLGEYLAKMGKKQLRIAETEKYAHVTFFFNGGVEEPNENEVRVLINSPKVATYDLQPEMSAPEVTARALEELDSGEFDVMILNFANCDMVGHTGVIPAAVKAVHTVDECVKKITDKILSMGGSALVTADHGNADKMLDTDGSPFTAHTTNARHPRLRQVQGRGSPQGRHPRRPCPHPPRSDGPSHPRRNDGQIPHREVTNAEEPPRKLARRALFQLRSRAARPKARRAAFPLLILIYSPFRYFAA